MQYYIVEVTYIDLISKMQCQKILPSTMSFLKLLPTIDCISPLEVLHRYKAQKIGMSYLLMRACSFYTVVCDIFCR